MVLKVDYIIILVTDIWDRNLFINLNLERFMSSKFFYLYTLWKRYVKVVNH